MLYKRDSSGASDNDPAGITEPKKDGLLRWIAKKLGLEDRDLEEIEKGEDDGGAVTFDEILSADQMKEIMCDLYDYIDALKESMDSIAADATITNKQELMLGSLDQFHSAVSSAIPEWLQGSGIMKSAISEDRMGRFEKTIKSLQELISKDNTTKGESTMSNEINKAALPQEVQVFIAKLEAELAALKAGAAEPVAPALTPAPTPDQMFKSLDPSVRKAYDEMKSRAEAAEGVAKKVLDDEKTKEFIAKAAGYTNIGIKADEFGLVLKSISEKNPEAIEKIEAVLKAANEAVGKGNIFGEAGSSRNGARPIGGNASWEKIQESAMNMVTKAGTPMSKEQAVTNYLETAEGKAQYTEYMKEREVQ
jgi:hypothetical protein